jgi:hypothetical protein
MTTTTRRRVLVASLLVAGALGAGCNVLSLPFFVFGPEPKREAELLKLAADDKKQPVRVAILVSNGGEIKLEFMRAEYQLADLLGRQLTELCKYNGENVTVVPARKVEEFKSAHPEWNRGELELAEIGRRLKADYVVFVAINSITMYETGSLKELFRGQLNANVSVLNVNQPDDGVRSDVFRDLFPEEGPVPVGIDKQPDQFRQEFLTHAAKKLSWFFTSHPTRDSYDGK